MGLFDLPGPAIAWADTALGAVIQSDGVRIALWGVIGAILSMGVYWVISPQRRIAHLIEEERRIKQTLWENEELAGGMGAARRLLGLALARIGLVLGPVLIAALPVLCLMAWLNAHYAHSLPPPGEAPALQAEPTGDARWIATETPPRLEIADQPGSPPLDIHMTLPFPVVHKELWWNLFFGNPLGYLPEDSRVERVEIALPERHYLSFGPNWLRGWEAVFIVSLLLASILIKVLFRIR